MSRRPVRRLPERVANQIAAGEVVARPASVVKELVENALDAGARRVRVEIDGGGIQRIAIVDDGHGMSAEDARLALERHATSKIREAEDLTAIDTFGFRGEALPSIASVSRLLLRTRPEDEDAGVELSVEGGAEPEIRPTGTAVGTTVEVLDLFYNVPARRKFLRAVSTESAHVTDAVRRVALARPDVQLELVRDGRQVQRWLSAPSREERVSAVLREAGLLTCRGQRGPVGVEAYLAPADRARSGAAGLYLFVGERPIVDRALARAVAAAFGDALERGRYPVGAVFLDIPLTLVDVNVHPQKAEVRFAHARAVTDALYSVVAGALATTVVSRPPHAPTAGTTPPRRRASEAPEAWEWRDAAGTMPAVQTAPPPRTTAPSVTPEPHRSSSPAPATPAATVERATPSWRHVATVGRAFGIFEGRKGIAIVAAARARRWLLEREAEASLASRGLTAQRLLFPVAREVSEGVATRGEDLGEATARLGFDLRRAGPRGLSIHAVPRLFAAAAPERLADRLFAALERGEPVDDALVRDLVALTAASAPAMDASLAVAIEGAEGLVEALAEETWQFPS
ncbi:MAG: DNA mismatch repair endonuclease MutL [Polyangiaceae bacterium]